MDLQRTSSSAPVCDAEFPAAVGAGPRYPHPDAAVRLAERQREDASLKALEAEITQLWGHINAATAHFLALLAEFDRREGWAQHGIANCAHWLSWQCGIGPVAAREKVRVARALTSLPKIAGAFGEGRLSYSKVRALTRVATAETEDTLLNIALRGTAAHVERTVRGFRRAVRHLERDEAEAMHERRYLDCWRESDGSVRLNARLAPEAGEMLLKALEAAHAQLEERAGDAAAVPENVSAETSGTKSALPPFWDARPENVSAETPRRSVGQRRADALEHILGRYLAGTCSGSANGAHEVVVHIAHDALCDVPESSGASFEHGGCRFPGCDRSRYVHAHHIKHWADGGETALGNLVTLCSQHHRQVHEGGYGVRVRDGEIQFTRPDGRVLPMAGRTGLANGPHAECFRGNISAEPGSTSATDGARRLAELNAARGLNIDAHTARCGWGGERMDYNIAIDGLCLQAGYR